MKTEFFTLFLLLSTTIARPPFEDPKDEEKLMIMIFTDDHIPIMPPLPADRTQMSKTKQQDAATQRLNSPYPPLHIFDYPSFPMSFPGLWSMGGQYGMAPLGLQSLGSRGVLSRPFFPGFNPYPSPMLLPQTAPMMMPPVSGQPLENNRKAQQPVEHVKDTLPENKACAKDPKVEEVPQKVEVSTAPTKVEEVIQAEVVQQADPQRSVEPEEVKDQATLTPEPDNKWVEEAASPVRMDESVQGRYDRYYF